MTQEFKESNKNIVQNLCDIFFKMLENYNPEKICYLFFLQFIYERLADAKPELKIYSDLLKILGAKFHPYSVTVTLI